MFAKFRFSIRFGATVYCISAIVLFGFANWEYSIAEARQISFPQELEKKNCTTPSGEHGVCMKLLDCPKVWPHLGTSRVAHCSFHGHLPTVCCSVEEAPRSAQATPTTLNYPGCGNRNGWMNSTDSNKTPLIAGGNVSRPHSWPWMVAIFFHPTANFNRFLCGGTIVSPRFILTAAHCFVPGPTDPKRLSVIVGGHNIRHWQSTSNAITVIQVVLHPDYKSNAIYNDIALLKTFSNIDFGDKVAPVCLPQLSNIVRTYESEEAVVTGWGDQTFGGMRSMTLREVVIPVVPNSECNSSYSTVSMAAFPKGITSNLICAGLSEGGKDACQGDSGGPLCISNDNETVWTLIGIVSYGYRCAEPGFPGIYTRVSYFLRWISDNIRQSD